MKVLTISKIAACAFLLGGAAKAADLPQRSPAPMPYPVAQAYDWTGFYAGVHAGYTWGTDRTVEFLTANGAFTGLQYRYTANSVLGGVHAGYLYQFNRFVLGLEIGADITRAKGGFIDPPNLPALNPGGSGHLTNTWRASVQAKVGYAMGRFMPYLTGGAVFADMKYRYSNGTTGVIEVTKSNRIAYTLGAGISYAINKNWRASLEYKHTDFGDFFYASQVAFPGLLTGRQTPRFSTVKAKLSYRF